MENVQDFLNSMTVLGNLECFIANLGIYGISAIFGCRGNCWKIL
jgi:hypothetical protein